MLSLSSAAAQQSPSEAPISIAQATSTALSVNPAVALAQQNFAQAAARAGQAAAQRRFQLTFNSTGSLNNGSVYLPPPTQETFGQIQNSLTLPLPIGGKLRDLQSQSQSQVAAAEAQVAAARLDTAAQVQNGYFTLLKQQAMTLSATQNLAQTQSDLQAAQKRFNDGVAPQLDAIRAQGPVATAQAALLQAQSQEQVARETLNSLLQRDLDASLVTVDVPAPGPLTISLAQARQSAVQNSADVRAAEANVRAAQAGLSAAHQARTPDLSLQASDTRSKDLTAFSRLDTIQVAVTIPLSDGGLAREQVREQEAAVQAAQTTLTQAQQTAALTASSAYLTAQGALAQIAPTQTALDIAQTALDKTRQGYAAGLNTILDVINAEIALNQARIAHEQAVYDAASATAALNRALGHEILFL